MAVMALDPPISLSAHKADLANCWFFLPTVSRRLGRKYSATVPRDLSPSLTIHCRSTEYFAVL